MSLPFRDAQTFYRARSAAAGIGRAIAQGQRARGIVVVASACARGQRTGGVSSTERI
jgi:hypothetical protein